MKKPTTEREITAYLKKQAKAAGGELRKLRWEGRSGAPDYVLMLPARYLVRAVWVETKAPGKTPEPHQLREHERMRKMGQRVEVVDSFGRVDEVLA